MRNIVLIDDEQLSVNYLHHQINKALEEDQSPPKLNIYSTTNTDEFFTLCEKHKPYAVFLDIHMPKMTGLDIARELRTSLSYIQNGIKPEIVFCTAFDIYISESKKYNPIDFILKPVDIRKIKEVIAKLKTLINMEDHVINEATNTKLKDCLYFYAEDRLVYGVNKSNEIFKVDMSLLNIHELFSDLFVFSHRTYLINKKQVLGVDKTNTFVYLTNKKIIPISRRKRKEILSLFP